MNSMNTIIVPLKDELLADAEAIIKDNFDIFSHEDFSYFRQQFLEYLIEKQHTSHKSRILVMNIEDVASGVTILHAMPESVDYFKIELLAIKKHAQHKGHGSRLMKHAFDEIKKLGGKHVLVETAHERHNENAETFYKKHGFEKMGMLPHFYIPPANSSYKPENIIIFLKTL
jgi:ribosomal protein S18 acetylase RimI-like enzyme